MFLPKISRNLHMPLAAMTHLPERLCLNELLTQKVENSLNCLVGTRIPSVHDGMAIYFALKNINKK
jgi:hypothetical protein